VCVELGFSNTEENRH